MDREGRLATAWAIRRGSLIYAGVLVAAVVLLYGQTASFEFLAYDDDTYVTQNVHIQRDSSLKLLRWAATSYYAANWHPLTWLSHAWDWRVLGASPRGHHMMNVGLHAAVVCLLFLVCLEAVGRPLPAVLAALWFALHPLRIESVAWVAQRKELLAGLFALVCVWAYLRYAAPGASRWWYGVVVVALALSLAAKPTAVTLPPALLLLDVWPLRRLGPSAVGHATGPDQRFRWSLVWEKVPLLGLSAVCSLLTLAAQRAGGAVADAASLPWKWRLGNACQAYVSYAWRTVWPTEQPFVRPLPDHAPEAATTAAAVAVLAVLSIMAVVHLGRRPYLAVGWFWFLGSLVPMIGLVQVGLQATADRYTYWPHVGVALALSGAAADGLAALAGSKRRAACAACVALLGLLAWRSWTQLPTWHDTLRLTDRALVLAPANYVAHQVRGWALLERGDVELAREHYERSVELRPSFAEGRVQLATALLQLGRFDRAEAECRRAIALRPTLAPGYEVLGVALAEQGRYAEARSALEQAVHLARDARTRASAHSGLGYLLWRDGNFDAAERHCRTALDSWPGLASAHLNLSLVHASRQRWADAVRELEAAAKTATPERIVQMAEQVNQAARYQAPELMAVLARNYARSGRAAKAQATWQRAIALARSRGQAELAAALEAERTGAAAP